MNTRIFNLCYLEMVHRGVFWTSRLNPALKLYIGNVLDVKLKSYIETIFFFIRNPFLMNTSSEPYTKYLCSEYFVINQYLLHPRKERAAGWTNIECPELHESIGFNQAWKVSYK